MTLFKTLTPEEETEFRQWAHDNYKAFDPIPGIWHPIVVQECAKINEGVTMSGTIPPVKTFRVTAKQITPFKELDHNDQECLGMIIEPYEVDTISEDRALDMYHNNIPIACLEDFEITCKCID